MCEVVNAYCLEFLRLGVICYTLIESKVSLVARMVKNLPAMQETQVGSLGQEGPLEEEMATHSSILAWRIPMNKGDWGASVHGSQRVGHD